MFATWAEIGVGFCDRFPLYSLTLRGLSSVF